MVGRSRCLMFNHKLKRLDFPESTRRIHFLKQIRLQIHASHFLKWQKQDFFEEEKHKQSSWLASCHVHTHNLSRRFCLSAMAMYQNVYCIDEKVLDTNQFPRRWIFFGHDLIWAEICIALLTSTCGTVGRRSPHWRLCFVTFTCTTSEKTGCIDGFTSHVGEHCAERVGTWNRLGYVRLRSAACWGTFPSAAQRVRAPGECLNNTDGGLRHSNLPVK